MKFLSIAHNNLCSTWNDSFQTANNSVSHTVVKVRMEVWPAEGTGEWEGRKATAGLQSKGNLLVSGLSDKASCSSKWPHGFDCFHGCVRFHLASSSRLRDQWLLRSHEGQSNALISRLIHIPSELEKIEACMWRIIINTRAVSPSHKSGRTLHNHTAHRSRDEAWAVERQPGRPWPRH